MWVRMFVSSQVFVPDGFGEETISKQSKFFQMQISKDSNHFINAEIK